LSKDEYFPAYIAMDQVGLMESLMRRSWWLGHVASSSGPTILSPALYG